MPSSKRPALESWPPSSMNAGGKGGRRAVVRCNCSMASLRRPAAAKATASRVSAPDRRCAEPRAAEHRSLRRPASGPKVRVQECMRPGRCLGSTSTPATRRAPLPRNAASAARGQLFPARDRRGSHVRMLGAVALTSVSRTKSVTKISAPLTALLTLRAAACQKRKSQSESPIKRNPGGSQTLHGQSAPKLKGFSMSKEMPERVPTKCADGSAEKRYLSRSFLRSRLRHSPTKATNAASAGGG